MCVNLFRNGVIGTAVGAADAYRHTPVRCQGVLYEKSQIFSFEALNPFFEIVLRGLSGLVDGEHYFDTFADDAIFESRFHFPGWPVTIRGRANLMASLSGYGKTIKLHPGEALVVHRTQNSRVVIHEYEVHGEILSSGAPYDNRIAWSTPVLCCKCLAALTYDEIDDPEGRYRVGPPPP
jgi:ketosteroid isomerase-like protein